MLDGPQHPFLPQNGCENKVFMSEIGFPASLVAKQRQSAASDGGSHSYKAISHHRSTSVVHHRCAMESPPHGMTLDTPPTPPSPVTLTHHLTHREGHMQCCWGFIATTMCGTQHCMTSLGSATACGCIPMRCSQRACTHGLWARRTSTAAALRSVPSTLPCPAIKRCCGTACCSPQQGRGLCLVKSVKEQTKRN